MSSLTLTVIVIARNEERTIGACLQSCIDAVARAREAGLVSAAEVVLVDSASTDRTTAIAAGFPIRTLSLPPSWPLSAAAGRFIGLRMSSSDVVLFVDGDYVMDPDWLSTGLRALHGPSIAGVCGVDRESLPGRSRISRYTLDLVERSIPQTEVAETEAIAVGLYRRTWIERAGGIQPFLRGAEDRDLAIRVRALGGRLLKTRAAMGTHHWAPGADLTLVEYLRSVAGWSFGEGQAARRASQEPTIRNVYLARYFHLRHLLQLELALLLVAWGSLLLASLATASLWLAGVGLASASILVLGSGIRRRESALDALFRLHVVPYVAVRVCSFFLGWLRPPRPTEEYPAPSSFGA